MLTALAAVGSASAVPAAADVSVALGFGAAGTIDTSTKTTSKTLGISAIVEASSFTKESVRLTVRLGDGLRWGGNAPDTAHGCTGVAPTVCTGTTQGGSSGNFAFWAWQVLADGVGHYSITASVEGAGGDPDASNNTVTFHFDVVAPGGGGGGGTTRAVTAGAVKLSPAKPRAGSTVIASVRVARGGSAVRPTGIACSASLGAVKVKGGAKSASGLASCRFKTPQSASGTSLAGTISFRAGGSSFTKRFAVKLR